MSADTKVPSQRYTSPVSLPGRLLSSLSEERTWFLPEPAHERPVCHVHWGQDLFARCWSKLIAIWFYYALEEVKISVGNLTIETDEKHCKPQGGSIVWILVWSVLSTPMSLIWMHFCRAQIVLFSQTITLLLVRICLITRGKYVGKLDFRT